MSYCMEPFNSMEQTLDTTKNSEVKTVGNI